MAVVKKFKDLSLDELMEKEWYTYQPCFFHRNHPMRIEVEDNVVRLLCCDRDDYIQLKYTSVEQVVGESTSLLRDDIVMNEAGEYVRKLKVFTYEDLEKTLKRCFEEAMRHINVSPIRVKLERFNMDKSRNLLKIVFTTIDGELEDTHMITYPLRWGGRGAYLDVAGYRGEYNIGFLKLYLTSRNFEEKVIQLFRSDILYTIDRFHCELDSIKIQNKIRKYIEELGKELGLEFRKEWVLSPYYESEIHENKIRIRVVYDDKKGEPIIDQIIVIAIQPGINLEHIFKELHKILSGDSKR